MIWYWSKGLFYNTPTHAYGFKVKVTDLEIFNANVFNSYFPNHNMDWVYIWYDDRYRSKVISVIPTPKVKVTHIEILNLKYV